MRGAAAFLVLCAVGCETTLEPPPTWEKGLATTTTLYPARRGLKTARGTIHVHSVRSHDACDGVPLPGGMPAQPCYQHLRDALCTTHQDYAMLTDHDDSMADTAWPDLFIPGPGDEPVMKGGMQVASKVACPDGSRVLITAGGENDLMPVGLERHVSDDLQTRHDLMNGHDAASVAAFRAAGGVVLVAHGESHPIEELRAVGPEGMEVYNLHANLAPNIREAMGLDPTAAIVALSSFLPGRDNPPTPDLAFLAFVEENAQELGRFDTLLSEGKRIHGTFGLDSHENVLPTKLSDGERADSHRRMMRWFGNHLLVPDVTPDALKAAIIGGRGYNVVHVLGDPVGFDFRAEQGGAVLEIGAEVTPGATLILEPPAAPSLPGQPASTVALRLLHIAPGGKPVEVASGATTIRHTAAAAGAYRAEVYLTPGHLTNYMGNKSATLLKQYLWVFANPIYVR
jgi:hypothetical protein